MKQWRIEYYANRNFSPMSWWVHQCIDENIQIDEWRKLKLYEPEFPPQIISKGYPYLFVTIDGYELEFSSSHEVKHCIKILEQKHLPNTKNLVCQGSTTYGGFNHWLAQYPSGLQS